MKNRIPAYCGAELKGNGKFSEFLLFFFSILNVLIHLMDAMMIFQSTYLNYLKLVGTAIPLRKFITPKSEALKHKRKKNTFNEF